jgi:hypothetical protein
MRAALCLFPPLVAAACSGSPSPAVTIAPALPARIEAPSSLPILPLVLALPSAPVAPVEPVESFAPIGPFDPFASGYASRGDDAPEAIELPASLWELPPPLRMRPLAQLSPEAARFLAERGGPVTAGVFVAHDNAIYVSSPELALPMASVAKLLIMLALIDRAEAEGRPLNTWEIALLEPMVVWSDNDSATILWDDLGQGAAVDAYLAKQAIRGIVTDPVAWGDSRASGPAVAWLLARLAFGDLVSPEHRELALDLLARAASEQSWGVGSGATRRGVDEPPEGRVAVKDGWYPANAGWRAGSAGLVLPGADLPGAVPYSIAVLTAQNALLDEGIATIDGFASRVHAALAPREGG